MCEWFTVRTFCFSNGIHFRVFNLRNYQSITMAETKSTPAQNQINIELSEEIAEGIYSNLAMIAHSNSEFVIDFIRLMPGVPKARVKARVIITPEHAKRLLAALKDNISKYEATFGPIKQTNEAPQFPMNFGGTIGEA
jgi:hypothetical protein